MPTGVRAVGPIFPNCILYSVPVLERRCWTGLGHSSFVLLFVVSSIYIYIYMQYIRVYIYAILIYIYIYVCVCTAHIYVCSVYDVCIYILRLKVSRARALHSKLFNIYLGLLFGRTIDLNPLPPNASPCMQVSVCGIRFSRPGRVTCAPLVILPECCFTGFVYE